MDPVDFPESNSVMTAPEVMNVHSYRDGQQCITCWKPSKSDLVRLCLGEPIWLHVVGAGMPPVAITVDNPFQPPVEHEPT